MSVEVTLWGVRGSLPSPRMPETIHEQMILLLQRFKDSKEKSPEKFINSLPKYMVGGYGGNTTCVQVSGPEGCLLIDAGTGIRNAINQFMVKGCAKGQGEVNIFMTHFHWDHIIGLPFFVPVYIPGNKINFYAVQPQLEEVVRSIFQKPYFPVPFEALGSKIAFHQLAPRKTTEIAGFNVTPYQLDHPDPCWGLRVECEGKSYAHCVDTEAIRVSRKDLGDDLPLYQNADLMVFDAQYSIEEAIEKRNWGHASAQKGLEIASREGIKKVVFVHHDPMATDDKTAKIAQESVKFFEEDASIKSVKKNKVIWEIGHEGKCFKL